MTRDLTVVSVAALVQKPLTSIISLPKAKISEPADLKGKTIGTAGIDYQDAYLKAILAEAGVGPARSRSETSASASAPRSSPEDRRRAGRVLELRGQELKLRGKQPRIIRIEEAGVPTYNELVLVANEDALERDGDKIRAFIGAISRGTRDLRRNPDKGSRACSKANPDLDPELQRASVKVTLPLFFPPEGEPFGWQDPAQWDEFSAWMKENQLLENAPDPAASFTTTCCPAPGSESGKRRACPARSHAFSSAVRLRHDPDVGLRRLPAVRIDLAWPRRRTPSRR